MAVGQRFMSPETQVALAAQSGQLKQQAEVQPEPMPTEPQKSVATVQPPVTEPAIQPGEQGIKLPAEPASKMETPPEKVSEITDDTIKAAGLDKEALIKQVADNGGIVPDSLKAELAEKFTDEAIAATVQSVEKQFADAKATNAKTTDMNTYIFETLASGDATKGESNFRELSTWCQDNMPNDQIAAINALLSSNDKTVVRYGLQQAVDAWKKGKEKSMMSGDAQAAPAAAPKVEPLSRDEFTKIVGSDKYQTDMAYRNEIDNRRRETMKNESGFFTLEYSKYRPISR